MFGEVAELVVPANAVVVRSTPVQRSGTRCGPRQREGVQLRLLADAVTRPWYPPARGIPTAHLARALPGLRQPAPSDHDSPHHAAARWQTVEPAMQPLPACTTCTIRRSPHAAAPAWIHPAPHLPRIMICTRHQQAASDPRHPAPLDIRAVPELTRAHLRRRRPMVASLNWASTITTRWYDHRQHLHHRWRMRLHWLIAANPHIPPGPASPALTCRDLITYPETLIVAAALDRLPPHPPPRTRRPRPALATPDHTLNQPTPRPCRKQPVPAYRRANHTAQKPPPHSAHCAATNIQLSPRTTRPRRLSPA